MKIEYKESDIVDRLDEVIGLAEHNGQRIDTIRLTEPELREFCELHGLAFSKVCGYSFAGVRIAYDWSSDKWAI